MSYEVDRRQYATKECKAVRGILDACGIEWYEGVFPNVGTDFTVNTSLGMADAEVMCHDDGMVLCVWLQVSANGLLEALGNGFNVMGKESHEEVEDDRGIEALAGEREHHKPRGNQPVRGDEAQCDSLQPSQEGV